MKLKTLTKPMQFGPYPTAIFFKGATVLPVGTKLKLIGTQFWQVVGGQFNGKTFLDPTS